jgi:glycerophosphoryl diester phosphodiesterase
MSVLLEILQSVVDLFFYLWPYPKLDQEKIKSLNIVAHRGWHNEDIRENSMESFDYALKNGVWGVEFDIRWTIDNIPVVAHDADGVRLWDNPLKIAETTFLELRKQIPDIASFEEVVSHFGQKLHFFIELKEVSFENKDIYKKKLTEILTPLKVGEDFHFLALSLATVLALNMFDLKYYFLVAETNTKQMSDEALLHNLGGISGHFLLCSQSYIKQHHLKGQKVGTGFVRTQNCLSREFHRGADYYFTNHPWNLIK